MAPLSHSSADAFLLDRYVNVERARMRRDEAFQISASQMTAIEFPRVKA
jgi:hypothetical protein